MTGDGYLPVLRSQHQSLDEYMPMSHSPVPQPPVDDYMPMMHPQPPPANDYMDMSYSPRPSPRHHVPLAYEQPSPSPPPPPPPKKLSTAHQVLAEQFTPEQLNLLANMLSQLRVDGGGKQRSDDFGKGRIEGV